MRVLFATDGQEQSNAAIAVFQYLALKENDEIKIIDVIEVGVPLGVDIYGGYLPDQQELEDKAKGRALSVLDKTAEKIRSVVDNEGVNITTEVLVGKPESKIVERAEEMSANLIVVGSHGYKAWERLLLGSVSDAVVHHSPCSVLVVR